MAYPKSSATSRKLSSDHSNACKVHGPDSPEATEYRRLLKEARLSDHIQQEVDKWPPLTDVQRDRLAALIHGGARL